MNKVLECIYREIRKIREDDYLEVIDKIYCNKFTLVEIAKNVDNPKGKVDLTNINTAFGIEIHICEDILDLYAILEHRSGQLTTVDLNEN